MLNHCIVFCPVVIVTCSAVCICVVKAFVYDLFENPGI